MHLYEGVQRALFKERTRLTKVHPGRIGNLPAGGLNTSMVDKTVFFLAGLRGRGP